ncbi:hypothetical protein KKE28_04130, partial [Patescibacteria group bacterium]|nr:hypothetical protein [Patescibacteria group bacterium]
MSCENFYRRIKKLIKVLILLAVIIPGCRSNTSAVRAVAMLPEVDSTLFDPQTFLCELSGRTVSES